MKSIQSVMAGLGLLVMLMSSRPALATTCDYDSHGKPYSLDPANPGKRLRLKFKGPSAARPPRHPDETLASCSCIQPLTEARIAASISKRNKLSLICGDWAGFAASRGFNELPAQVMNSNGIVTPVIYSQAKLQGGVFTGMDLSGVNFTGARLTGAQMDLVDLHDANLTEARLQGARLTYANLTNVNLTQAPLALAWLQHAKLNVRMSELCPGKLKRKLDGTFQYEFGSNIPELNTAKTYGTMFPFTSCAPVRNSSADVGASDEYISITEAMVADLISQLGIVDFPYDLTDLVPPTITLEPGQDCVASDGSFLSPCLSYSNTISFFGAASDNTALDRVEFSSGGPGVLASGTSNWDTGAITLQNGGYNYIAIWAVDVVGNYSTPLYVPVTYCAPLLSITSFPALIGPFTQNGTISFGIPNGCDLSFNWSISEEDPYNFLSFNPTSGSGVGSFTYSFSANPTINNRSGSFTVLGHTFNITQQGDTEL